MGAHYTSPSDILLIVEPVLIRPLRREWDAVREEALPLREKYNQSQTVRAHETAKAQLLALRDKMLKRVRETTVLDPACGSGNFLYIALQQLMNLELDIVTDPLWHDIDRADLHVSPRQLYGIEIDEIAHALTSIVVWIGYIQWREHHGYHYDAKPLLEDLSDNIVRKDAILPPPSPLGETRRGDSVSRPNDESSRALEWPPVDVIVGNPPFLGGSKLRGELGDEYYERLTEFYAGRVPGFADLVCYWFEKAREQIENGQAKRAGLLATNSIRGGANREVLKRIKDTGDIFMAWSDRPWILDGAAVRVSMVGFDKALQAQKTLNGLPVSIIHPNLSASIDITKSRQLPTNLKICFIGTKKAGPFDIDSDHAQALLSLTNASGLSNSDVVSPWLNGQTIVKGIKQKYIINFGEMSEDEARLYEAPYQYVRENVYPLRQNNNERRAREKWWWHRRPAVEMIDAIRLRHRYIVTPRVSKHRLFVWCDAEVTPDDGLYAIARDDDYFFGILHSKLHETWSLRMGTSLEDRPRYTPTTTFETFPFPWPPGSEDKSHPAHARVSAAAAELHEERHAWLNPDGMSAKQLKDRTLTNLYNALAVFRERDSMKTKPAAADFAPRLDQLHRELDEAVCDAYGWDYAVLDDAEEILRRLLALNLARSG